MCGSAAPGLERFGAVSCACPDPSLPGGGSHPADTPKSASSVRRGFLLRGPRGGRSPPGESG
eukprot:10658091-Alexandrium_andersonii.AAC.1